MVHPGLSRPMIESHHAVREGMRPLPASQNMGSEQSGTATSNLCPISTPKNSGAITPTMGKSLPSSRTVRLVTAGSPANSDCQNEYPSTGAGLPQPGRSSAAVNTRPTSGRPPSTRKKSPLTKRPSAYLTLPSVERLNCLALQAITSENAFCCLRILSQLTDVNVALRVDHQPDLLEFGT